MRLAWPVRTIPDEAAVLRALNWLEKHQSRGGHWDVDHFDDGCDSCRSPGYHTDCDSAVTGLVLLCFLGQNHTPGSGSRFSKTVDRAEHPMTLLRRAYGL